MCLPVSVDAIHDNRLLVDGKAVQKKKWFLLNVNYKVASVYLPE